MGAKTLKAAMKLDGEADVRHWFDAGVPEGDVSAARKNLAAAAVDLADDHMDSMVRASEEAWRSSTTDRKGWRKTDATVADLLAAYREGAIEGCKRLLRRALRDGTD